jgi:polygalacturonase
MSSLSRYHRLSIWVMAVTLATLRLGATESGAFDVRAFGAAGDGKTIDSPAINRAIAAAAAAGGGTVRFPAGTYVSGSIRLKGNITLHLEPGSVLRASPDDSLYDPAEPNEWGDKYKYQDFGHSHWHNSLIWGEGLENVAITGTGLIDGSGLKSGRNKDFAGQSGGNKTIALKNCRNVLLRDFTILRGGWFALLATGVDNLTIDNLRVDTNRDGFDIDCCRNVRVSNCTVNAPDDDAIVLKSSFGLGFARATENVTITNCHVSGYDVGTMLDGTFQRQTPVKPGHLPMGRIKFGTESNGGFKNITVSNCVFDYSCGLALETVDGALLEDVTITNLTMRDVINAPIFLRLGARMRGPEGAPVGSLRRVTISNVVAHNVAMHHGILIAGLPGHPIEDLTLSNIFIGYQGGGTTEQAERHVPEYETDYPEPGRFGTIPSYGMFARHVKGLTVHNLEVRYAKEDLRPAVILDDVANATFDLARLQHAPAAPSFVLKKVTGFTTRNVRGLPDTHRDAPVADEKF